MINTPDLSTICTYGRYSRPCAVTQSLGADVVMSMVDPSRVAHKPDYKLWTESPIPCTAPRYSALLVECGLRRRAWRNRMLFRLSRQPAYEGLRSHIPTGRVFRLESEKHSRNIYAAVALATVRHAEHIDLDELRKTMSRRKLRRHFTP